MTGAPEAGGAVPDVATIRRLFAGPDGAYRFARWRRPYVPIVFGVDDATLAIVKGAVEALAGIARHPVDETDAEQGANLMFFFVRDWPEVVALAGLDDLVPGIGALAVRLGAEGADIYRHARFEADGAIRAGFVFVRMGGALADEPADLLTLRLVLGQLLLWSDEAFQILPPLVAAPGGAVLNPAMAAVLGAAYDPVLPDSTGQESHALRLHARMAALLGGAG